MLFLKLIGPVLAYVTAVLKDSFPERIKRSSKWKAGIIVIITFGLLISIGTTVLDDRQKSRSAADQDQRYQDLKARFDRLTELSITQDARADGRTQVLQERINDLNRKLEPFIKLAVSKYPQLGVDDALQQFRSELKNQRSDLDTIRQFTRVAELDARGLTGKYAAPLIERTDQSLLLEGTFRVVDNKLMYLCDERSMGKFNQLTQQSPNYPFSYFAIASCLRTENDNEWKKYAEAAYERFSKSTTIEGHHSSHDEALQQVKKWLGR